MLSRRSLLGAAAAILVVLPHPGIRAEARLPGRSIVERLNRRDIGGNARITLTLTLIDESGTERTRHLSVKRYDQDGHYRTLYYIESPTYLEGMSLLVTEGPTPRMHMHFPKSGQTVPVVTRGLSALATDFSCEDLKWRRPLDDFLFTQLGRNVYRGSEVVIVEMIPRDAALRAELGYAKALGWVRPDLDMIVKSEFFDDAGRLFKVYEVGELRNVENIWTAWQMSMKNLRARHTTIASVETVDYYADVVPAELSPQGSDVR